MSEPLRVVLEAGTQDAEVTVRVARARDELLDELEAEGLRASRVVELSAASTLEVLSTSLATYGPVAGAVAGAAVGVRSVPKEAWEAFGKVLTSWSTRHADARIEYEFVDGRKIIVENDPRAVRRALDEVVLPDVREQQIVRHDQWRRLISEPTDVDDTITDDDQA